MYTLEWIVEHHLLLLTLSGENSMDDFDYVKSNRAVSWRGCDESTENQKPLV